MPTKFKLLAGLNTAFLLFLSLSLFAQTSITGRVLSSTDKKPVVGATVQVNRRQVSHFDWIRSVHSQLNSTQKVSALVITIVGFEAVTVPVTGTSVGDIMLSISATSLNDVIVTGYTAQKKKISRGAVAVVNIKDMKEVPGTSTEALLQGSGCRCYCY